MTIEESLRRDLSYNGTKLGDNSANRKENELDFQIVCSSKQVLMRQIDFKPAKTQMKYQVQQLRNKYIFLNPPENNAKHPPVLCSKDGSVKQERLPSLGESDDSESTIELPKPAHVIYPASKIKLSWQVNRSIGCTLANQGNTCFMNSVLQCLTYTPPLYNYYQTGHHKQTCKRPGLCVMCTIENHVHMVMKQPVHVITPVVLTSKFRNIQKQMETGRQHDVHEFLRVLLEEMHKSCLYGFSKDMDRLTEETSAVYQVFGGKIRNRIFCTNCKYRSDTFETFLDLPLDLKSKSIEQCLRIMMKPEMLFGDNKYKCSGCKKLVDARKTFRIVKPPNVLTVVLKRYDASGRNIKNKRFIEYPEYFDLRPFMAGAKKPVKYKLYGVLPHEGNGSGYGHYYTYVRAPNNLWYKMNDHASDRAGRNHVMNSEAYLLFYVRIPDNDMKSTENGRVQPVSPKLNHTYVNGTTSFAPVSPKVPPSKSMQQREEQRHNIPTALKSPTAAAMPSSLPRDRAKLSFTINRKGVQSNTISPKANGSSKPSNIGNTLSRSTAESFVKPRVRTESPNKSHASPKITATSLVPYGSDSSDSEDYDDIAEKLSGKDSNKTILAQKSDTDKRYPVKEETKTSPLSNHKNLMAVRSTESPLRLTITTNCNASKLTSTGLWKVSADAEPQTPSVASDASNTSASSTSEWNVQEKKMLTPLPKESSCEAEFLGWTVIQKPDTLPSTPGSKNSSSNFPEKRSQLNERNSGSGDTHLQPPLKPVKNDIALSKSNSNNFENNKETKHYSNGHQNGHSYQQMDKSGGHIHDNKQNSKPVTNNKIYNLKRQFSKSEKPKTDQDDESKKSRSEISACDSSWKQSTINSTGNVSSNSEKNKSPEETRTKYYSSAAPSQTWDHHVRDGYHRKDRNQATRSSWDGRDNGTSSKEVNKVLGSTSMRTYGSSVKSWDDGPSEIDIQAKRSWWQEKRVKRDSYEEELDRGKMKKIKSNDFRERHHHGYNAFQRYQNHHNNLPPPSQGFHKQPYVQGYNRFHPYRNRHGWNSNKTWRR